MGLRTAENIYLGTLIEEGLAWEQDFDIILYYCIRNLFSLQIVSSLLSSSNISKPIFQMCTGHFKAHAPLLLTVIASASYPSLGLCDFHFNSMETTEDITYYFPGGYHPIVVGDILSPSGENSESGSRQCGWHRRPIQARLSLQWRSQWLRTIWLGKWPCFFLHSRGPASLSAAPSPRSSAWKMDGKMPDLGLILSSLSATKVCTLSLVRLTVWYWRWHILKYGTGMCSSSVLPRVTPWGCSIVKILTNNLSDICYVFGVGHGIDLRYRSTWGNILNE